MVMVNGTLAVTIVSFPNRILGRHADGPSDTQQYCYNTTGTLDTTISADILSTAQH